jgi:hypothetical protein
VPSPLEVSGSAFGRSDIVQLSAFPTKGRPPVAKTARRLAKGVTRREFIALVRAVEECTCRIRSGADCLTARGACDHYRGRRAYRARGLPALDFGQAIRRELTDQTSERDGGLHGLAGGFISIDTGLDHLRGSAN